MRRVRYVFVVIAVLGLLSACDQRHRSAGAPLSPAAAGRALFEVLRAQVYGTVAQRAAGEERAWLIGQNAIAGCARSNGVDYEMAPYRPQPVGEVAPGNVLAFAPRRDDFGVARRLAMIGRGGEPVNPGLARSTGADERARWSTVIEGCRRAVPAASGPTVLQVQFVATLNAIQHDHAPWLTSQFPRCMTAKGVPVTDLADAQLKVEKAFGPVTAETVPDPTRLPGWAAAVAYEKRMADADWMCRNDDVYTVMSAAGDRLTRFGEANAGELAAAARSWGAMPAAAAALRVTAAAPK